LLLVVFGAGGLRHHQATRLSPPHHVRYLSAWGERGLLIGRIEGDPEPRGEGDKRRVRLALKAESWQPEGGADRPLIGRVLVTLRQPAVAADGGDRLRLRCRLSRAQQARNPGAFDYRRFLALQGIHATASVANAADVEVEALPDAWWRRQIINPVRSAARRALGAHLSGAGGSAARHAPW
jgi:competence protein ComEC